MKTPKHIVGIFSILLFLTLVGCIAFSDLIATASYQTVKLPTFNENEPAPQTPLENCTIYQVGTGIGDITEYPNEQINGGYDESTKTTQGIHTRQFARAFIIADKETENRVAFLVIDDWAVSIEMREEVVRRLATDQYKDKFENPVNLFDKNGKPLYNINNIMLTASHTHTGVMGDSQRRVYNITAGGYIEELLLITVEGIVDAIAMAHNNLRDATIEFSKEELLERYNITKNRSLLPYLHNPDNSLKGQVTPEQFEEYTKEEIVGKEHVKGKAEALRNSPKVTDKTMYLFRFKSYPEGKDIGLLNWYGIHGTAISASIPRISGGNKAVAQQITEAVMGNQSISSSDFMSGKYIGQVDFNTDTVDPGFLAGFAQGALGDVASKRVIYSQDKYGYSLDDEYINVLYSARSQSAKALELYNQPQIAVNGNISSAMQYVAMDEVFISNTYAYEPENYQPRTFSPASGWSMAYGSEINIATGQHLGCYEGMRYDNSTLPLINVIRPLLFAFRHRDATNAGLTQGFAQVFVPSEEFQKNHRPKPILFAYGNANPSWIDTDVPFQLFKIGNIVVIGTPYETTTISAQRIKKTVQDEFEKLGQPVDDVIYAGNSNGYVSYMATPEEYELQHYEGACTVYGINQLPAVQQEMARLTQKLVKNETGRLNYDPAWIVERPELVPDHLIVRAKPRINIDRVLAGKEFGEQVDPLEKEEWEWGETFSVEFYSSNMNGNIFHDDSFFYIQRYNETLKGWITVATDNDYNTNVRWNKKTSNYSTSTILWRIPAGIPAGEYRVVFKGSFSQNGKKQQSYSSVSTPFFVKEKDSSIVNQFEQTGNSAELIIQTPQNADKITLRLKEQIGDAVLSGEIIINNEFSYPIRNLKADGTPIDLFFPDLTVSSVQVKFTKVSSNDFNPAIDYFALSDTIVQNGVFSGKFALFCK